MTKTHFKSIALTLNANRADLNLVLDLADTFEELNPRFDRALFVEEATINIRVDALKMVRDLDRELKN